MTPATTVLFALLPVIIWRMYSRTRRLLGRQRSTLRRHRVAVIIFPLLIVLLGLAALPDPMACAGLAGGVAVGIGLAVWGLRLTCFENTPQGFFYTPNAYIGIALSLLLVGRILYRVFQIFDATDLTPASVQNVGRSPLTLLIVGMLAGYYSAYAIGILRWRRTQHQPPVSSAN